MNLREYNYVDYIWDVFFAKIKHREYTVDEVRCLKYGARCPITGKKQFWKKCTRIRFTLAHEPVFYCEEYEFERFMLTVDFNDLFGSRDYYLSRQNLNEIFDK
jgi:hypothetical protein